MRKYLLLFITLTFVSCAYVQNVASHKDTNKSEVAEKYNKFTSDELSEKLVSAEKLIDSLRMALNEKSSALDKVLAEYENENTNYLPMDTIDTNDKFTKIVLYDNSSVDYIDLGRPVIDDKLLRENWYCDQIHAYKDFDKSTLPDEIDLMLVDSVHSFKIPIMGKVNSRFRMRRGREHRGIDIKLKTGDPIVAAFDGIVRVVENTRNTGGYGNLIVIRHSNGLETYYGHLSKMNVKVGELVKAGEVIGLGGSTGRSSGPHLHFEVRYMGQYFDPERIFDFETGDLRIAQITLKKHYFSIYSHYGQTDEASKEASGRLIHVIKNGDTLGKLANRYGTTVSSICKKNNISSRTILNLGRRIIIR